MHVERNEGRMRGGSMPAKRWMTTVAAAAIVVGALTAMGFTYSESGAHAQKLTKVTLQLKWVTQAQFACYYAALQKGYYKKAGLDVKMKVGGARITPEQVVIGGGADLGC